MAHGCESIHQLLSVLFIPGGPGAFLETLSRAIQGIRVAQSRVRLSADTCVRRFVFQDVHRQAEVLRLAVAVAWITSDLFSSHEFLSCSWMCTLTLGTPSYRYEDRTISSSALERSLACSL